MAKIYSSRFLIYSTVIMVSISFHKAKTQSIYHSHEYYYNFEERILKLEDELIRLRRENEGEYDNCRMIGPCRESEVNRKYVTFSVTAGTEIEQVITGGGQTVILRNVLSNIGGGYNSTTGIFTAPTPGTYGFFFSIENLSKTGFRVFLILNGDNVAEALAEPCNNGINTGSNMVTLVLRRNDLVYIKSHSVFTTYDVPIQYTGNSFSGFLLSMQG